MLSFAPLTALICNVTMPVLHSFFNTLSNNKFLLYNWKIALLEYLGDCSIRVSWSALLILQILVKILPLNLLHAKSVYRCLVLLYDQWTFYSKQFFIKENSTSKIFETIRYLTWAMVLPCLDFIDGVRIGFWGFSQRLAYNRSGNI